MRAVLLRETGDASVLRLEELDRPEPGDGEVLIGVRAVSINPIDWKYRRGMIPKELPAVLGSDISGTVVRSRAEGFAEGDEVFGFAASGAYAEFASSPATLLAHKPSAISHEQAAAIPVGGLTAWQALFDRGALQRGQSALIAGAAGGVGHFAVQFARHVGARAIGTGSARSRDFVIGLGAAEFVDYTSQDVGNVVSGVDVAFDTVGGETTQTLLATVREGGVLITIAGAPPEQAAALNVRTERLVMSPNPEQLAIIAGLVAAGEVHVEIAEVLPLAEVQRAHALSESGRTRGKIILSVGDSPH
jgi:NADPH:quinone reductase-like Zn-dependent oxidoreductase